MTSSPINVGTNPSDGTGDNLRTAFVKVNNNFANLDNGLAGLTTAEARNTTITTVTANTTLDMTYSTVLVDASAGAVFLTLPTTAGYGGVRFTVKKIDTTSNPVTLIGTIDGATNYATSTPYDAATVQFNGTSYYIIG